MLQWYSWISLQFCIKIEFPFVLSYWSQNLSTSMVCVYQSSNIFNGITSSLISRCLCHLCYIKHHNGHEAVDLISEAKKYKHQLKDILQTAAGKTMLWTQRSWYVLVLYEDTNQLVLSGTIREPGCSNVFVFVFVVSSKQLIMNCSRGIILVPYSNPTQTCTLCSWYLQHSSYRVGSLIVPLVCVSWGWKVPPKNQKCPLWRNLHLKMQFPKLKSG